MRDAGTHYHCADDCCRAPDLVLSRDGRTIRVYLTHVPSTERP